MTFLNYLILNSNNIRSLKGIENLIKLDTIEASSNLIESIIELKKLVELKFINLFSNQIRNLSFLFNEKYFNLERINLNMNQLKNVASFSFSNLSKLSLIYLDENLIETLETNSFYNLSKIELISLRKNRIKSIADFLFHFLKLDFSLDLFGNKNISQIYSNSMSNVFYAYISYESICSLTNYNFVWLQMETLNLGKNEIRTINENTIKGTFSYLLLDNNLISLFETNSFGQMSNLIEIYFSKNLIKKLDFHYAFRFQISTLEFIDFSHNQIEFIDGFNFFSKFPNLESLDLAFNQFHSLSNTYFLNLFRLKYLILNNNQILTIENGTFSYLKNLLLLDLSQNLIYNLGGNIVFDQLSNLRNLILSSNQIEQISMNDFRGLSSLLSLDLRRNQINQVEEKSFLFLRNIILLKLGSNKLKSLNKSLAKLKSLRHLDVSFNNLNHLDVEYLETLSFLDVSHNTRLNQVEISNNLIVLNVSNTSFELISDLNFSSKSSLEELDLSFNNLTGIDFGFFTYLETILKLNLKQTILEDYKFLNRVSLNLRKIDLSENQDFEGFLNLMQFRFFEEIKISNSNLSSFEMYTSYSKLNYLDLSQNIIKVVKYMPNNLIHLNLSQNSLEFILNYDLEFKYFIDVCKNLKTIDLSKSFSKSMSNRIFFFDNLLEFANFSENNMNLFPKFCQSYSVGYNHCKLKELKLNSNNFKKILFSNLIEMTQLEYLNLENNLISYIESHSFLDLINLETLILSLNKL